VKKCIVSFSDNAGNYRQCLNRLALSLDQHASMVDRILFNGVYPPGSPKHENVPYAFKAYALMEARKRGYDLVIWADANTWLIKNIDPVFDYIEKNGYMFFYNGMIGNWSSDECLRTFGVNREDALQMNEIMGCCFGLDLRQPDCDSFLNQYHAASTDGVSYQGSWTNSNQEVSKHPLVYGHRHDQTVASLILNRMGMKNWIVPHETFLYYWDDNWSNVKDSVVFLKRGM